MTAFAGAQPTPFLSYSPLSKPMEGDLGPVPSLSHSLTYILSARPIHRENIPPPTYQSRNAPTVNEYYHPILTWSLQDSRAVQGSMLVLSLHLMAISILFPQKKEGGCELGPVFMSATPLPTRCIRDSDVEPKHQESPPSPSVHPPLSPSEPLCKHIQMSCISSSL